MNSKLVLAGYVMTLGACVHVAPYQRERLAHHSMVEPQYAGSAEMHVRAVHEGAVGGQIEAVSGCGCN